MELMIADVSVRNDGEGRYCLNDLHRAGGGMKRHQPNRWLRSNQAKELIAEVATEGNCPDLGSLPVKNIEGRNGGTFACDDLLIAYANWISAKFYLRVIRAFKSQLGIDLKPRDRLIHRQIAYERRDAASREKGSMGGRWMAERKKEIPKLKAEGELLLLEIQPPLFRLPEGR